MTATLTTTSGDPNPSNNSATHTSRVLPSADLEVRNIANAGVLRPGETIAYTFTVTNHGPQDAYAVSVIDYLSPLVNFVSFEQTSGPAASLRPSPYDAQAGCYMPSCDIFIEANIPILPNGSTATFRMVVTAKTSFEAVTLGIARWS